MKPKDIQSETPMKKIPTSSSVIMQRFNNTNSFAKNRDEISKLAYNNFISQVKASGALNSCMKNVKHLTERKEENNNYNNNDISIKENSTTIKRNRQTLDKLIEQYAPIIIKSLAFTHSDKPNAKILIKNKYSELFLIPLFEIK